MQTVLCSAGRTMIETSIEIPGFRIVEPLSQKTKTLVFRAVRERDGEPVVLKTNRDPSPSPKDLARFRNAFDLVRRLDHPHLVKGLELLPMGKALVMVMEDFGGVALSSTLADGPLDIDTFIDYALKLTSALGHIHEHRVIHKDIKPANIVHVPSTGRLGIIDFGIAGRLSTEKQELVSLHILEGSLPYMSPEQTGRTSRPLDYRTDFYALGVTCFEMLTGRRPFESRDALELVHCHLAKSAPLAHEVDPSVPPALSEILRRLMAKNAAERYQSARGLEADLQRCRDQWRHAGEIAVFDLGRGDELSRFQLPQQLYGRERQVDELVETFVSAVAGGVEIVLVSGESGVGKSALLEELQRPIAENRGYFIEAKFDQYRRDTPFSAVSRAFGDLVRHLAAEPAERVSGWRHRLLDSLGGMGRVLIDVIPEVKLLIGEQPSVPELMAQESLNRFVDLFLRFLKVLSDAGHPLVCFLDDLQWADVASLHLIEKATLDRETRHLLFLGAFRSDEVGTDHPLRLAWERIEVRREVRRIELGPLTLAETCDYVADCLHVDAEQARPLARLVHAKTGGNPFFLGRLLLSLQDDGWLHYDFEARCWTWDLSQVPWSKTGDQVVDLMVQKIQKLEPELQDLLRLVAFIGSTFDFETVVSLSENGTRKQVARRLFEAVEEGLLLSLDSGFNYLVGAGAEDFELEQDPAQPAAGSPRLQFLHDRIQEAAYALTPAEERSVIHRRIGRALLDTMSPAALEERLFEVVGHLNSGAADIVDEEERTTLAMLNLRAGIKARLNTAHAAARDLLQRSLDLMPEDAWARHYPEMFDLHLKLIECAFLCGDPERGDELFEMVDREARDRTHQARAHELLMGFYFVGRLEEGVELARKALRLFGIELPQDREAARRALEREMESLGERLAGREPAGLETLPTSSDESLRTTMSLLHQTWGNCYHTRGFIDHGTFAALRIVSLSLEHGYTDYTAFGYVIYGSHLSWHGEVDLGYAFGRLALALTERYPNPHLGPRVLGIFGSSLNPNKNPVGDNIEYYEASHRGALKSGDLWAGVWAVGLLVRSRLSQGVPLDELCRDAIKYRDYAFRTGFDQVASLLVLAERMALSLMGKTDGAGSLDGENFREADMLHAFEAMAWEAGLFQYHFDRSVFSFLNGDLPRALKHSRAAVTRREAARATYFLLEQKFWHTFIECAAALEEAKDGAPMVRGDAMPALVDGLPILRAMAEHSPINFRHKLLLVEALQAALDDRLDAALLGLERAAESALQAGVLYLAAVANELAGDLLVSRDLHRAAAVYFNEAIYLFERWGAVTKIEALRRKSPVRSSVGKVSAGRPSSHGLSVGMPSAAGRDSLNVDGTSSSAADFLDLQAVLKASRALSSKIRLSELLRQVLTLLLENAGAEKGALLISKGGLWVLVAQGNADQEMWVDKHGVPYVESKDLSTAVVQYVLRTDEDLVVDDALLHDIFASDPYIRRHQTRSLLCLPIRSNRRRVAILYMENNLARGVFTAQRLEVLKLLSTQVAISIENALLYADLVDYTQSLQSKVEERTRELQAKNEQLEAKNEEILRTQNQLLMQEKLASLGTMTAGVAHEIKNPLNFVRNFATLSKRQAFRLEKLLDGSADDSTTETAEDIADLVVHLKANSERIEQHSRRIDNVVGSMLSLSRSAALQLESADFNELVLEYVNLAYHGMRGSDDRVANVNLQLDMDPGIGQIDMVPQDIGRLLLNLSNNAIYAAVEAGAREGRHHPEFRVQTRDLEDRVELRVRDNGPGIPATVIDQVFNPFFTTKPTGQGTGLGLAICRHIVVEQHHGTIEIDTEPGDFTEVIVRLPKRSPAGNSVKGPGSTA